MNGYDFDKLIDLIELIVENRINQFYTCLPCKVKSFDKSTQKVEVDILIKIKKAYDDEEKAFQSISDIPVGFYNSSDGSAYITFPIKAGDTGIILFSTLNLDNYLSGNGDVAVNSNSYGRNQLKDAMFLPMFKPWNKALSGLEDDHIVIHNDQMTFTIQNDGKLQIANSANELIAVVDELITKLLSATTITMLGASPFTATTIADLTAVQAKLATFKV